ncbi:hypothetical protein D3C72_1669800 [compost metagenome]
MAIQPHLVVGKGRRQLCGQPGDLVFVFPAHAFAQRVQRGQPVQRAGIEIMEAQLAGNKCRHGAFAGGGRAIDGNNGAEHDHDRKPD